MTYKGNKKKFCVSFDAVLFVDNILSVVRHLNKKVSFVVIGDFKHIILQRDHNKAESD